MGLSAMASATVGLLRRKPVVAVPVFGGNVSPASAGVAAVAGSAASAVAEAGRRVGAGTCVAGFATSAAAAASALEVLLVAG
nr:hypothetical protein [Pseudarthrobacter sp. NamE5]